MLKQPLTLTRKGKFEKKKTTTMKHRTYHGGQRRFGSWRAGRVSARAKHRKKEEARKRKSGPQGKGNTLQLRKRGQNTCLGGTGGIRETKKKTVMEKAAIEQKSASFKRRKLHLRAARDVCRE